MDLDDIKINCHAVLTSGGGSLSERQFLSDYRSLIGGTPPYGNLGFRDLRSFLESLDGEFYYSKNRGETIINHVDAASAHVGALIARQRSRPKSRSRGRRPTSSLMRPRLPPRLNQLRIPPPSTHFIDRSPPKARYGNSPIIPQRQPLSASTLQKRLTVSPPKENLGPPKENSNGLNTSMRKDTQVTINKTEAKTRILSIPSVERGCADSSNKDSPLVEVSCEDATYIDIQAAPKRASSSPPPIIETPGLSLPLKSASPLPLNSIPTKMNAPQTSASPPPLMSIPTIMNAPQTSTSPPPLMSIPVVRPVKSRTRLSNQQVLFTSHVEELSSIVKKLGLGKTDYSFIERNTRGKRSFIGKVKIVKDGKDLIFSTYPDEKATCEEAQECVANVACDALKKCVTTSNDNTSPELDELMITERVKSIVSDKPNGMINSAIEQSFKQMFNCALPSSWLTVIEDSHQFSVEWFNKQTAIIYPIVLETNQSSPVADIAVTPACTPSSLNSNGFSPKEDINANVLPSNHVHKEDTLPSNHMHKEEVNSIRRTTSGTPPKLDPPKDSMWDVFVSCVSQDHVWIRLIGDQYDKVYNEMMNNLELSLLSSPGQIVQNPQVDNYYAVKFDNCWCRVKLLEINRDGEEETAEVFLLDNGEEDVIALNELTVLQEEYLKIPPQALQCSLAYVDLSNEKAQQYMLANVMGSSFVAQVIHQSDDNVPCIVLHNTEVENKPVNINHEILDEIVGSMQPPQLPQEGRFAFMRIMHINIETPPFVQIKGKELEYLEMILEDVSKQDLMLIHGMSAHPKVVHLDKLDNHMFLVKSASAPDKWRRGIIVGREDVRHPLVHLVDYGYQEYIMISSIFDIDKVIPPLSKYPKQAVQVNLAGIPPAQLVHGVVARVKDLAPSSLYVLGKVVRTGSSDLPAVEFYKRVQPDNQIVFINADLQINFEEYSKVPVEERIVEKRIPDEVALHPKGSVLKIGALPSYTLPPIGETFDVYCTMSSNPFNFIVQPVQELNSSFNVMMKDMQDVYEAQHRVMPTPSVEHLEEHSVFAVKHPKDLLWYRVSVVAFHNQRMVSVRYSDYGDVGLVSLDRLRYLQPRFMKIPTLAIRAKLDGVKPKNGDWSVDDCVKFNELVENKPFVSQIKRVNSDNSAILWKLSLELIDTTQEDVDIVLADKLIQMGIADRE